MVYTNPFKEVFNMPIGLCLPESVWKAMAPSEQKLHRIRVSAYFLAEQRQKDGTEGNSESDWLAAEQEEDRRCEAYAVLCKFRVTDDRDEKIRLMVVYLISETMKLRVTVINNETVLPTDKEARQRLGQVLGWEIINSGVFRIPDEMATVGALIEALKNTPAVIHRQPIMSR
jgi:hypothetical protein